MDHHQWWQHSRFLPSDEPRVQLHQLGCRVLELAGTYDHLDVSNLACLELLLREVQKIEHHNRCMEDGHHSGKGGKGQGSRAAYARSGAVFHQDAVFSGLSRAKGEIMCSPALLDFVGKELERDTNVQKQLRKTEDERLLAQKDQRGGKKTEEG